MEENSKNGTGKKNSIIGTINGYLSKLSPKNKVKVLVVIILVAVFVVIYFNYSDTKIESENNVTTGANNRYSYYVSSLDYCNEIEQKLKKVLSNIYGVGNVEVMITLDSSMELVFANSNEANKDSIFTSTTDKDVVVSSPIILETNGNEEPLVIKEVLPNVKGVLVVCSLDDIQTKLDIIHAVKSLLNIDISNIQVLSNS